RWDGMRLADVGAAFDWASPGRLAVGVLIGFVLVAAHTLVVATAGHVRWERDPVPASGQTVVLFALAYLCLAAREELAFHGYPLRCLQQLFGVWPAQFAIAIVFAAEHWLGGWSAGQAIWGAAVGSLLFGMASIATRGLAIPIGMHAAWNYFDWLRGNRAANGLWRPVIERGFEQSANLVGIVGYVCIMLLAVLAFWFWYRRGKTREKSEMDDS
ncbi:MAG TPA: CPBP family intramembrane glutamic endopeptidase, partial [Pirellulales bacterium]